VEQHWERKDRKESTRFFPLNSAIRLATLSRESSVEKSKRLAVYRPSDGKWSPLVMGGDGQDEANSSCYGSLIFNNNHNN
jgi:hypothetical protein